MGACESRGSRVTENLPTCMYSLKVLLLDELLKGKFIVLNNMSLVSPFLCIVLILCFPFLGLIMGYQSPFLI